MGKSISLLSVLILAILFTSCGGQPAGSGGTKKKGGGPITGIMINAQRPDGQTPIKGTFDSWKVVDSSGTPVFSDGDIQTAFKERKGVMWQWEMAVALDRGRGLHLGTNHYEAVVEETQIATSEDGKQSATFRVSDATAGELRGLPDFDAIVGRAFILILVGKIGE